MKQYKANRESYGELQALDCINWAEYSHKPETYFQIGYNDECLLVKFEVVDNHVKAQALNDNERIYKDSCVEIFLQDADGVHYFNFEVNCIGALLASRRTGRKDPIYFTPEQLAQVKRSSSLPHEKIDQEGEGIKWSVSLEIPFSLLGYPTAPNSLRANLYKCGDETAIPHYVSWNEIPIEAPDFHRPECFGEIILR